MPSYVVTGAARGLGRAFVRYLSSKPENVVFGLVRNKDTAKKLLELASGASNIHVLQADITDVPALKEAAGEVARVTGGTLDYLINNAAYLELDRRDRTLGNYLEEHFTEDMNKSFEVNVLGVIYTINTFLPLIRKGSVKKVATLSSGLGDLDASLAAGIPHAVPYSVSKAAVNMVMVKYAVRFKPEGIVFLTISPGWVNTLEGPPTPAVEAEGVAMRAALGQFYPNWNGKQLEPEESVRLQLQVLERTTIEGSGAFVSQNGDKQWV